MHTAHTLHTHTHTHAHTHTHIAKLSNHQLRCKEHRCHSHDATLSFLIHFWWLMKNNSCWLAIDDTAVSHYNDKVKSNHQIFEIINTFLSAKINMPLSKATYIVSNYVQCWTGSEAGHIMNMAVYLIIQFQQYPDHQSNNTVFFHTTIMLRLILYRIIDNLNYFMHTHIHVHYNYIHSYVYKDLSTV